MTEMMARQGLGLSAPTSRQDIVSALLNDYGNSFGRVDTSPSAYSPVPALKELPPPPPPRRDSLNNKPLPAVQRMSMKFQLRVDEDVPLSPGSPRRDSIEQRARRKIVSRSLSRDTKPPSRRLTTSNGSTATIPATPELPVPAVSLPSSGAFAEKDLPPPPPEKSERRKSVKQGAMGNQQSKAAKELARNDSLMSQGAPKVAVIAASEAVDGAPIVKRKALPIPAAVKKFKSLAELGQGPRGGKGGPMPLVSAPRKTSIDSQASYESGTVPPQFTDSTIKPQQEEQPHAGPAVNALPPTPDEDDSNAAPTPPRKVFTAIGLPSNPRAKGPTSPLHMRGKSSTGFNILKAHRPAPPIPTTVDVNVITPEMTPSPTLKPDQDQARNHVEVSPVSSPTLKPDQDEARNHVEISPVSPLPSPKDQHRPFSYEARDSSSSSSSSPSPSSASQKNPKDQPATPATVSDAAVPPTQTSLAQLVRPLRTTSLDLAEPSPGSRLSTPPAPAPAPAPAPGPAAQPPKSPPAPLSPPAIGVSTPSAPPAAPAAVPFTPLTRQPQALPAHLIPSIGRAQLDCYTGHGASIWSSNAFQPMGCMVCHGNGSDRKWACTWCQLRICRACSDALMRVPGRDLRVLLRARSGARENEKTA